MSPIGVTASARMDRIYRHQRFIYDLTRKYYLLGRDRLLADLRLGDGQVLEIGCGTGRNLTLAARRYPEARFYGIDISLEMLATAQTAFARAGLTAQVRTALGDATDFDPSSLFGREKFDRVFMSYTLSMIPDWRAALDRAASCLATGGRLSIVDFGQQERLPAAFKRLLFAWLALFHVYPIAELATALEALAKTHGLIMRRHSMFRDYALYVTLERTTASESH